jgi:hypothetical protein
MSWSGWQGGAPAVPIFDAVAGIPAQPLTNFTAQEVRLGGHVLIEQRGWCRMHQDAAHSNSRFGEDDSYSKFCIPDTPVFTSNVTQHVPIFYWHEEQRKAAEAAGASFDILEGPSPFGGFGDGPSSWEEMHIDPEQSWLRATQAIKDTADQAAQLQQGVPLRPQRIEGGRDGVRYGFDALIAQYRRCPWIDCDGKPQMLIPELPDQHTDILLHKFYCTCLAEQMTDMEIVSRIRLYGVQSGSTAATGVDVLQNYGMDAAGMAHLQADRACCGPT